MAIFHVTNCYPLHDGYRHQAGPAPDFDLEVIFPEGYDHLGSDDSPIQDAIHKRLQNEGWDFNGCNYTAQDHATTMEETSYCVCMSKRNRKMTVNE